MAKRAWLHVGAWLFNVGVEWSWPWGAIVDDKYIFTGGARRVATARWKMSGELKACGNCGCAAGVERNEYNWRVQYRVACSCGIASKWYKTRKDALGAWNLRVVTVEQVEKMARELAGGGGKNWCEALGATRAMLNAAGLGVAE